MPSSSIAVSLHAEPTPKTAAQLYLDLLKKTLTRAIVAKPLERHTIWPRSPKSKLVHLVNGGLAALNLEMVRLTKTGPEDYLESGHEAGNRAEDAQTMLGMRQFDHAQRCIEDVIERQIPGDLLEAGVWRGGMTISYRAVLKAYEVTDKNVWMVDSFAGLPPIDREKETFAWDACGTN